MKPRKCPECGTYLSEDKNGFYCTYCDYEECARNKPIDWRKYAE